MGSMTSRSLPIAVLLCLGLVCCESVKRGELVGTWVLTDQSRERFLPAAQKKAIGRIVLNANGTFVADELPEDLLYGPPEVSDRLVRGSGVWELVSREGGQQVQLNFEAITIGQRGKVPYGTQLNVSKGWSAATLFYFQGDPDQGRRIEFERKQR
jgi:hypothetical protein